MRRLSRNTIFAVLTALIAAMDALFHAPVLAPLAGLPRAVRNRFYARLVRLRYGVAVPSGGDIIQGTTVEGSLRRAWRVSGAPTNGGAGTLAGIAEPGDLLIRYDAGNVALYQNTNTKASPTWTLKAAGGASLSADVNDMAANGTGVANTLGGSVLSAPINHIHKIGTHDHSDNTKGDALVLAGIPASMFTADVTGRGKFASGFVNTALLAAGVISADAAGRALFAAGVIDAATAASAIANSAIPAAKVNFTAGGTPTTILPDDAAAAGSGPGLAFNDHTHGIAADAPSATNSFAASATEGVASQFLRADAVFKARIANNVYWLGRNAAGNADINAWKINASDLLEFGANLAALTMGGTLTMAAQQISFSTGNITFSGAGYIAQGIGPAASGILRVPNNTYAVTARNAAGGGDVSAIKINASDLVEFGANLAAFTLGGTVTGGAQGITFTSGYTAYGTSPAASRGVRAPNNTPVYAGRNFANGADIDGWKVNAEDDYEAAADVNLGGNKLYGGTAANADLDLNATTSATVTTSYILTRQMVDATVNSIAVRVKAGAIGDGETAQTDLNGELGIDSTNGRLYYRYGAAWHYSAITAGFVIPEDERTCAQCGAEIQIGERVVGRINELQSDGARHGLWEHMTCPA